MLIDTADESLATGLSFGVSTSFCRAFDQNIYRTEFQENPDFFTDGPEPDHNPRGQTWSKY